MKKLFLTILVVLTALPGVAQDIIITRDEKKIDAKVLEISDTEIKYKEADDLLGPSYVLDTEKVLSVVLGSGKVKVFGLNKESEEQPKAQEPQPEEPITEMVQPKAQEVLQVAQPEEAVAEPEPEAEPETEPETDYLDSTILNYLIGYPKNVVLLDGDYSMLYSKEAIVYVQINYDNSEIVKYNHNDTTINAHNGRIKEYIKISPDFAEFDKSRFEQLASDKYNSVLRSRKCTMMPSSELIADNIKPRYALNFTIDKIDLGNSAESFETVNGGNKAGGAILCGKITITPLSDPTNPSDQNPVCTLYVDRVKGKGSFNLHTRIVNALEELFGKQLFFIKQAK